MALQMRTVTVKYLPEKLGIKQRWTFFRELKESINGDRPRIVLDCSSLRHVDRYAIHMLLRCLEEVMKRNGDVKLAAVPPEARPILARTGVSRLFEIFDTASEAVNSFNHISPGAAIAVTAPQCTPSRKTSAA
jgi:anti-sigma B factor antagonist